MKDSHMNFRLPADLAEALEREAELRNLPKSLLAREAIARYLAGEVSFVDPASDSRPPMLARDLAAAWGSLPHLDLAESEALAADIEVGRGELNTLPADPWA